MLDMTAGRPYSCILQNSTVHESCQDTCIYISFRGIVKHYHVKWKKNMMFTLDENAFYDSITEMVEVMLAYTNSLCLWASGAMT